MKLLGAVLAGGQSRRFGSDKALVRISGQPLIERTLQALGRQCDDVCVVGRAAGAHGVADWPGPGMGPLAGLAGALRHAGDHGFDMALSVAVDIPEVPDDLVSQLSPAPAHVENMPVVGLWRVSDLPLLEEILAGAGRHSMRAFAKACEARAVTLRQPLANINTPEDLAGFLAGTN